MRESSRERWVELERLLDCARELGPEHPDSPVAQTLAADAALGAALERLLGADHAAGRFLEEPAATYAAPLLLWVAERDYRHRFRQFQTSVGPGAKV